MGSVESGSRSGLEVVELLTAFGLSGRAKRPVPSDRPYAIVRAIALIPSSGAASECFGERLACK